jgi:co-chaperonin GroES (HSP10)
VNFRPLPERLLIRRDKPATVTAGGILIPERHKSTEPAQGEVLAAGEGCTCKPGDRVLFEPYTGQEVDAQNWDLVVREEHVIAVLG